MMATTEEVPLFEDLHLNVEDGDDDETNALQVVLLGKTGSGKSSLANTILGGLAEFNVSHSAGSETKVCQTKSQTVNGRKLRLIDTPGLFDTEVDNTQLSSNDLRLLIECAPGVHAFLILLKVEKYTKHEKEVTDSIFKQFTKEALKYTTVVFNHGDQLPDEITIESWVEDNEKVKALVQKCGGRCHVFDNKYWNQEHPYRNNQVQIENLLTTIEETAKQNGGRYYTNETLQMMEREIQDAILQNNESSPEDDAQSKRDKAKEIVFNKLWPKIKHVTVGSVIGVLVGGLTLAPLSVCLIPSAVAGGVVAGGAVLASGVVGGLVGQISKQKKEKKQN